MNVFVVNSGSSSLKYQLFRMPSPDAVCIGSVERIGAKGSVITHKVVKEGKEQVTKIDKDIPDHEAAMLEVGKLLTQPGIGVIQHPEEIEVVGHRIVQGGETLQETMIITPQVMEEIKKLFPLAPLHNPGHYKGIEVAEQIFTKATQVAVFDTTFHQTIPEKAFRYAIAESFYKDFGIRVYGFHGTSHKYVSEKAIAYLDKPDAKIITIHLGNGCSMAAINAGKCIDTSMGLTPLEGLVMGTRSGSIDPSVLLYLIEQHGYTADKLSDLLNKKSGMLGLTGKNDMRDIARLIADGSEQAKLAFEMYVYRIKKYIGAYIAALNGLDAIIFTAGVGENDALVREKVCADMSFFGIAIDHDKNNTKGGTIREIGQSGSPARILVVATNEELEIAKQCITLLAR